MHCRQQRYLTKTAPASRRHAAYRAKYPWVGSGAKTAK